METQAPNLRLGSIDIFRGATIAGMILVNAEFSHEASYRQLAHAAWNGWTFADTIFPCFLFIVGVSLFLSTVARVERGETRGRLLAHAVRRALLLFACGVVVDYLRVPAHEFPFVGVQDHLQLTGVLQKISICYLLAFLIFLWTGLRGVIAAVVGFNLLYLGLLYFYPVPGCGAGSLAVDCNFPGYIDETVLHGFRWNNAGFDPDGLGAILPATTSVLFGVLAGQLLNRSQHDPRQRALLLAVGGLVLIGAGMLLSRWVPINKQLWTTSFAVLMAGFAATGLAIVMWLVDGGKSLRRWLAPLEILGQNAIAAYLLSRLIVNVPRVHLLGKSLHDDLLAHVANPATSSLLFALAVLAMVFVAIWLMDRRGWRLKL
ncbi:MAG TPA: heparan-alpha-glucosaminide N-acetyltransferase domain-containing protein [Ilumatobacteraceae bacterium]